MKFELVVSPSAEADILDAFLWYEERQSGLGRRLTGELDLAFARIQSEPLSYQEDLPGIRRCVLHVFPYLVFYTILDERVEILAVIHASQDPSYIADRIDA